MRAGLTDHSLKGRLFNDIGYALEGGAKEIVLSGVNLGAWGKELNPQKSLALLITNIVEKFSPHRIRLSSLEPWDITDEFLEVLGLPGFCQHLHLPLQSGSDAILKRMGRRSTANDFETVVVRVRRKNPEIAITTDLMVGFPGESDEEFRTSLEFVRNINFAGGHVFSYSSRLGTAAEKLDGQVPSNIKKNRNAEVRYVFSESAKKYRGHFLGRGLSVLWERSVEENGLWRVSGLSDNYLRVEARSTQNLYNQITKVRILNFNDQGLLAEDLS